MKRFKKILLSNPLNPIYLIKLSDILYKKEVVKLINEKFSKNADILNFNLSETSIKEIFSKFFAQTLFDEKKIIVCNEGDLLKEKDKKFLINKIKKLKKVKNSILVIFFDKSKFNLPCFYEIKIPSIEELKKFIILYFKRNNIEVGMDLANFIVENTGYDYHKVSLELKKILSFAEGKTKLTVDDIKDLIKFSGEQNIFKLSDYFFDGDLNNTLKTYSILKKLNTNINLLVNIFQKNIINIARIKSLLIEKKISEAQISSIIGLNPYICNKLIQFSKKIDFKTLILMYDELYEIEKMIKSTTIQPEIIFENFLIKFKGLKWH